MDDLKALRFVQGAISNKTLLPEMKHFLIRGGEVKSFNGSMALCSPLSYDLECAPMAVHFIQAINHCEDVTSLGLTANNRLRVQSGNFKAFVECVEIDDLPMQNPEGDIVTVDGVALLEALEALRPFVGSDASRPWTNGILLRGQSAFATNNVCLVQYWLGVQLPFTANVPMNAIKEILRIGLPPASLQISDRSITFHYEDGRWIRSQLFSLAWPETLEALLEQDQPSRTMPLVGQDMRDGADALRHFMQRDARVFFRNGAIHTSQVDGEGASYAVEGLPGAGVYRLEMLRLVLAAAERADFAKYPEPSPFYKGRLRGLILGQNA